MGKPAKQQSLFKSTHDLKKLLTGLKKISEEALAVLVAGLHSEDEKLRLQAAQQILKFQVDVAKEINQDSINRLILQVKTEGLIGHGSTVPEDSTPKLDFDNIHEDFRNNVVDAENVVDLSQVSKIG